MTHQASTYGDPTDGDRVRPGSPGIPLRVADAPWPVKTFFWVIQWPLLGRWPTQLAEIGRLSHQARRRADRAEPDVHIRSRKSRNWWTHHLDHARWGVVSGTDLTPRTAADGDTFRQTALPQLPRIGTGPHPVVRSAWFGLAQATATWYAGQADLSRLGEREQICVAVEYHTEAWMDREQAWRFNELATINRLRDELDEAQKLLDLAAARRGGHGKGQVATNDMLVKLERAAQEGELSTRASLLAGLDRPPRSSFPRRDAVGPRLARLAQGATALAGAETALAEGVERARTGDRRSYEAGWFIPAAAVDHHLAAASSLLSDHDPGDPGSRERGGQLRAESAMAANRVLLHMSRYYWSKGRRWPRPGPGPEPGDTETGDTEPGDTDVAGDTEGERRDWREATRQFQAARAIHRDLSTFVDRHDKAGDAALHLNYGAGLAWSEPAPPTGLDQRLDEAADHLRTSLTLWDEVATDLGPATRTPAAIERGRGRCHLYLGDVHWRLADRRKKRGLPDWTARFERALACWAHAWRHCHTAGDVVGQQAAERRPGDRPPGGHQPDDPTTG